MECPACGSSMRDDQRICLACGEMVKKRVAASDRLQAAPAGVPHWIAFEGRTPDQPSVYGAGRPGRLLALIIDLVILGAAAFAISLVAGAQTVTLVPEAVPALDWWVLGPLLAVQTAYYVVFPASKWQATPGKRLLGMRIVNMDNEPISIFQSVMRFLFQQAWLFVGVPLTLIGVSHSPWAAILPFAAVIATAVAFWMLCANGRSPWDWMAGTRVVD